MKSILAVLLSTLVGTPTLHEPTRPSEIHRGFGRCILKVADQDGDGISELAIVDSSWTQEPAGIFIYSPGADRYLRVIRNGLRICGSENPATNIAGLPDCAADLAYMCWESTEDSVTYFLSLTSSSTGEELKRIPLATLEGHGGPTNVWSLGDVDGKPGTELLFHTWGALTEVDTGVGPIVSVYSLAEGKVLREHVGRPAPVADLDGDGVCDYSLSNVRELTVVSGKTGESIFEREFPEPREHEFEFYEYFPADDVNGDGTGDVLQTVCWGSYADKSGRFSGYDDLRGFVRVLSGKTGRRLWQSEKTQCEGVMWMRSTTIADRNNDGVRDFAVTYSSNVTTFGSCPGWRVYCGRTGKTLEEIPWGPLAGGWPLIKGYDLLEIDDQNGDGLPEIAFSQASIPTRGMRDGEVDIYSLEEGLLRRLYWRDLDDTTKLEEEK